MIPANVRIETLAAVVRTMETYNLINQCAAGYISQHGLATVHYRPTLSEARHALLLGLKETTGNVNQWEYFEMRLNDVKAGAL